GIERNDLLGLGPLRKRPDSGRRVSVGEVRPADGVQCSGRHGECAVERIRAAVAADDIAHAKLRNGTDDGTALTRGGRAPIYGETGLGLRIGVRGEADVVWPVRGIHDGVPKSSTARREDGPNNSNCHYLVEPTRETDQRS